jgi:hypothetical protein
VTSPFSLLAAAFGGGAKGANGGNGGGAAGASGATQDDLAFVDFAPGRAELEAGRPAQARNHRARAAVAPGPHARDGAADGSRPRPRGAAPRRPWCGWWQPTARRPRRRVRRGGARGLHQGEAAGNPKELRCRPWRRRTLESLPGAMPSSRRYGRERGEKVRAWLMEQGKLPAQRIACPRKGRGGRCQGASDARCLRAPAIR